MSRRWLVYLRALLSILLLVAVYRIGEWFFQPRVLFRFFWIFYSIILCCWSLRVVQFARRKGSQDIAAKPSDQIESMLLREVSIVLAGGFILTGAGMVLQGKSLGSPLQILVPLGHIGNALFAGLVCLGLFWVVHRILKRICPGRDPLLLPLAAMMCGIGLILLYRLGPDLAALHKATAFGDIYWLQLRSLAISAVVCLLTVVYFRQEVLDSLTRKRYVYVLLSVFLITLTALFGVEVYGRKLAINLVVMQFQTVELVKILALLFMVGYFRYEHSFLEAGKNRFGLPRGRYLLPYLTMWVLTLLPIFLQKDLGPTALIFALFLTIFYLGTGSGFSVLLSLLIMAGAGYGAYSLGYPSMVRTRVDMWLHPFQYSQNLAEAFWAIGSGGWFGAGSAQGSCHSIPVVQSDFNFAALAEEWGILGIISLFTVYALLVGRTLLHARSAETHHEQLFLSGLGALWVIQAFVIVGGNLGLLPLTGITLPFISYGGSSMLINFMVLGMIMRLSSRE